MYPLHSQWMAEQTMGRRYDPDHLDRGAMHARPVRATGPVISSRLLAPLSRLRAATQAWILRSSLGPLPDRCAGGPAIR